MQGANVLDAMANPWYPSCNRSSSSSYNFVMETPTSNSREQRNKAEKQRRDKLNAFISELARLVPMVAGSAKRLDKTSVLRLTATFLRIHQTLMGRSDSNTSHMHFPKHVDQFLLEQLICEQMGGFLLVVLPSGKIVFVSPSIENLLGHLQTDLLGQSLFSITAAEDHERLRTFLQCIGEVGHNWAKHFALRLRRAGPRSESAVFEPTRVMGGHRQAGQPAEGERGCSPASSCASTGSSSGGSSGGCSGGDIIVLFVKLDQQGPLIERLMEASKEEYVTRHLIDGRIVGCDQRISIIAGYMREEITGHSAFKYMHNDDVRWVMVALRQMYDRGESQGVSCYRLQSRNGKFIFLKTCGFLEIDDQGIVESFICVNTLVDEREGRELNREMKEKYAALLGEDILKSLHSSVDLVADPAEVDRALIQMMRNLPSPGSDHRATPSPRNVNETKDCLSTNDEERKYATDSRNNRYLVKLKTATISTTFKRQSSIDTLPYDSSNKRQRTVPQSSDKPIAKHYSQRAAISPVITDIMNQPGKSNHLKSENLKT